MCAHIHSIYVPAHIYPLHLCSTYVYVCMYVCMYLCIYVCMYVCMYVCIYVSMYVCICIYIYMYVHACVLADLFLDIWLYTHISIYNIAYYLKELSGVIMDERKSRWYILADTYTCICYIYIYYTHI